MPELPEVETIRKGLKKGIINKKIVEIEVKLARLIQKPEVNEFIARIRDIFVQNIKRRGKYILFFLNSTDYLVVHLGMSGLILYHKCEISLSRINEKHHHIIFYFEDKSQMIYNDVRQFGKIWLLKKYEKLPAIESLGFEPLASNFTFHQFHTILQRSKGNIKSLLMNQRNIAGIGNIYANEILFYSGVHPLRRANDLSKNESQKLYLSIRDILAKAIQLGGTTMIDESYRDSQGNRGEYGEIIRVYGKKRNACPFCRQPLEIIRIENRSTFFCPACQK